MGVRLVVEVLDQAPASLTPTERLIFVSLAERANDTTREVHPGRGPDGAPESVRQMLMRRTGLGGDGLTRALQRLAGRGLDPRVPLAIETADGRPLYGHRGSGTAAQFRVPQFEPLSGDGADPHDPSSVSGGRVDPSTGIESKAVPKHAKARTPVRQSPYPSPPQSLSPSGPSSSARDRAETALAELRDEDLTPDERDAVASLLGRLAPELIEQTAVDAVVALRAKEIRTTRASYVGRFSLEDVQRWAEKHASRARTSPTVDRGPWCDECGRTERDCQRARGSDHDFRPAGQRVVS